MRPLGELPHDPDAVVRLATVLEVIQIGTTSWLRGVASGKYPKPVRIDKRTVGWRVGDIRRILASFSSDAAVTLIACGALLTVFSVVT